MQQIPAQYTGQSWSLWLGREDAYRASGPDDFPYEMNISGFGRVFPHPLPEDPERMPEALVATPWLDEYTLQFAEATLQSLDLGRDDIPDVLAVSLSATDFIGHRFGPDSKEVHDQILRLDHRLGEFFKFLDTQVGLKHTLIVLIGDHGVAPLPEYAAQQGKRAKRFQLDSDVQAYRQRLRTRWGDGEWMAHYQSGVLYFDHDALKQKGIALADLTQDAAAYFSKLEPVARVYTREQLMSRTEPADGIERRLRHSFHPDRSGDVFFVYKPYYLERAEPTGTTHGSPYDYDSHAPLIVIGPGIKAGRYDRVVASADVAPTLAEILRVSPLNPIDGRALTDSIVDLQRPGFIAPSAAKPTLPSRPGWIIISASSHTKELL
jgi:predicted AlkP superfamily pyrophosphatase or phosphodiesterase